MNHITRGTIVELIVAGFMLATGVGGLLYWPPSGWDAYSGIIAITKIVNRWGIVIRIIATAFNIAVCLHPKSPPWLKALSILPVCIIAGMLAIGFMISGQGLWWGGWTFLTFLSLGTVFYEGSKQRWNSLILAADGQV